MLALLFPAYFSFVCFSHLVLPFIGCFYRIGIDVNFIISLARSIMTYSCTMICVTVIVQGWCLLDSWYDDSILVR